MQVEMQSCTMSNAVRPKPRQGRRPHYLREWAQKHGKRQADIARETGADKSLVSRWLDDERPSTPSPEWQAKLAEFFEIEPDKLFRHPDEEWFFDFFAGRGADEIERIKLTLQTAFPKRN